MSGSSRPPIATWKKHVSRAIAATHRDLRAEVAAGRFREDLYYRLNVIPIWLPPLRERQQDIPHLIRHFAKRFARRHHLPEITLSDSEIDAAQHYPWPGNIRELQNSVEKATVLQDKTELFNPRKSEHQQDSGETPAITASMAHDETSEYFPLQLGEDKDTIRPLHDVAGDAQKAAVIRALKLCGGNKSEAAKKLDISYKTLFNKIGDLNIQISTKVE